MTRPDNAAQGGVDRGAAVATKHFVERMRTRVDDALSCLLQSTTIDDAKHHQGVLFGLQWACEAFSYSTGHERAEKLEIMCGVSSGYINDAYVAAIARANGGAK